MNWKKYLLGLCSCCIVLALAFAPLSSSQVKKQYDPWADTNDDGIIDMTDIGYSLRLFATSGDPTKNVNVTNWPTATNFLTVILNESASGTALHYGVWSANETLSGIGGKSIIFTGGGVSGGASFTCTLQSSPLSGGIPGSGRVEVYDKVGNLLASFALPLNSMFRVKNVNTIKIFAEVPVSYIPKLDGYCQAFVVASVFWIQN